MTPEFYDKQKETHGKWATFVWVGSGVYLFATTDGASFVSWQALVFFLAGMFAAAIIFGIVAYAIQRGLAKVLAAMISAPSSGVATLVSVVGFLIFVLETIVIFFIARWVVAQIV